MRLKRLERTRKVLTTLVVAALVAAVSYAVSSVLVKHKPAFALSANKTFSITSTIYAKYTTGSCTGASTAKLYPGTTRCIAVTVHNPLSVAMTVKTLSMTVTGFTATASNHHTPACTKTMVSAPTLFTSAFVVAAHTQTTIDEPIKLSNTGTQDNCENGTFTFSYSGSATYTDTTTTSLTATLSGSTGVLKATVTPSNPTSDPYGPSGAPVHHVTFYLCGTTSACTTKTAHTVTLTTSGKPTLSGTASYTESGLSTPGTYYFEVTYPATSAVTGTFTKSTSSIKSLTVTSVKAATKTVLTASPNPSLLGETVTLTATVARTSGSGTPTGKVTFYLGTPASHTKLGTKALSGGTATLATSTLPAGTDSLYASYGGSTTYAASTSAVIVEKVIMPPTNVCPTSGYSHYIVGNPALPIIVGTNGNDFIYAFGSGYLIGGLQGNDCIWADTGANVITDGTGNDGIKAGNGLNVVAAGNGNDKVTLGSGPDGVVLGNGSDQVTLGTGFDVVALGNGSDLVNAGKGANDTVSAGNGSDNVGLGNGTNDSVTLGNGASDTVAEGNGASDSANVGNGATATVTLGNGADDSANVGNGASDTVTLGTGASDQVSAGTGASDHVKVGGGSGDSVHVGNGASDTVTVGNGNDTVSVGNGSHDQVILGSGNDTVTVGNGSTLTITAGNGTDTITVGNGSKVTLTVGNGTDTITFGTGSTNKITLGNGTDKVTLKGSHDTVTSRTGTETIYLGSGTYNTVHGYSTTKTTCYVPKPPSSYHGSTPAGYYDDTVTQCKVEET